jgi:hypothetical protein
MAWINLLAAPAETRPDTKERIKPHRNRLRQLKSALSALEKEGLVEIPLGAGGRNRYDSFRLLHEAGRGRYAASIPYKVPASGEWSFRVPVDFFLQGWLHALTNSEIAVYLMLCHLRDKHPSAHRHRGVYINGGPREDHYGLSRDTYEAHQMLKKFGLIHRASRPMRTLDDGTIRFDAYRFQVIDQALNTRAIPHILQVTDVPPNPK